MTDSLRGRTFAITGAARGIGAALAGRLAARGVHLALADVAEAELEAMAGRLRDAHGVRVTTAAVDVRDAEAVARWAADSEAAHGVVHGAVANAGVLVEGTFEQHTLDDWHWVFDVNVYGVLHTLRSFLPRVRRAPGGQLMAVSSVFGILAPPGQPAYCASKFAVRGLCESLQQDLEGSSVALTVVHPGGVRSRLLDAARSYDGEGLALAKALATRFMPAEQAGEAMAAALERRAPRLLLGAETPLADMLRRVAPAPGNRVGVGVLLRLLDPSRRMVARRLGGATGSLGHLAFGPRRPRLVLRGRVAAITGAASGIGAALAHELGARGMALALCDVDEAGLARTAGVLRASRVAVTTQRVDVASPEEVQAWADQVVMDHGAVHVLVNNAGVTVDGDFEAQSDEDWRWLFGVNVWGVVHGLRAFLPHLRAADQAQIVNVSSIFGILGAPGQTGYCAAKFAVRGLSESLNEELAASGVGVTVVHPGGIQTSIIDNARGFDASKRGDVQRWFDDHAMPPGRLAEQVAGAIARRQPRVLVGVDAVIGDAVKRLAPVVGNRALARLGRQWVADA